MQARPGRQPVTGPDVQPGVIPGAQAAPSPSGALHTPGVIPASDGAARPRQRSPGAHSPEKASCAEPRFSSQGSHAPRCASRP